MSLDEDEYLLTKEEVAAAMAASGPQHSSTGLSAVQYGEQDTPKRKQPGSNAGTPSKKQRPTPLKESSQV